MIFCPFGLCILDNGGLLFTLTDRVMEEGRKEELSFPHIYKVFISYGWERLVEEHAVDPVSQKADEIQYLTLKVTTSSDLRRKVAPVTKTLYTTFTFSTKKY